MSEMFGAGVQLMLLGMTVVFLLLSILVLAVIGMSRLALSIEGPQAIAEMPPVGDPISDDTELVAAVTAAIHAHRKGAKH